VFSTVSQHRTLASFVYAATALAPPMDPTRFLHLTRGQRYWGMNTQKNKVSFQIGKRVDRGFKAAITQFIRACDSRPGAQDHTARPPAHLSVETQLAYGACGRADL